VETGGGVGVRGVGGVGVEVGATEGAGTEGAGVAVEVPESAIVPMSFVSFVISASNNLRVLSRVATK